MLLAVASQRLPICESWSSKSTHMHHRRDSLFHFTAPDRGPRCRAARLKAAQTSVCFPLSLSSPLLISLLYLRALGEASLALFLFSFSFILAFLSFSRLSLVSPSLGVRTQYLVFLVQSLPTTLAPGQVSNPIAQVIMETKQSAFWQPSEALSTAFFFAPLPPPFLSDLFFF